MQRGGPPIEKGSRIALTASSQNFSAAERWAAALAEWAIPDEILEQAPESPWGARVRWNSRSSRLDPICLNAASGAEAPLAQLGPVAMFSSFDRAVRTLSHERALDMLPGTVLDVGAGGGAMSAPLRPEATLIAAVDSQSDMLDACDADERIHGVWPDVAAATPAADVVVCGHVIYNVGPLAPFVSALGGHARRRVVVEMTARHPMAAMAPLWRRFWGLERPTAPTWEDCVDVIREAGFSPRSALREVPGRTFPIESIRRRLCLPAEREAEVAAAIADLGPPAARRLATIWWDT